LPDFASQEELRTQVNLVSHRINEHPAIQFRIPVFCEAMNPMRCWFISIKRVLTSTGLHNQERRRRYAIVTFFF